mmetsp:Transcript_73539/g.186384  ORF Transcript_73539/g.186384 Transcript_73539/m.186384 type:complete len:205 (-) Transcript_73539:446-1060(-)
MGPIGHSGVTLVMLTIVARTIAEPTEGCRWTETNSTLFRELSRVGSVCFEECPQLCLPFSALVAELLRNASSDRLTVVLCASKFRLHCMYEQDTTCHAVADRARQLLDIPQAWEELNTTCTCFAANATTNTTTTSHSAGDDADTTTPEETGEGTTTASETTTSPPGNGSTSTTVAPNSSTLGLSGSCACRLALALAAAIFASSA